MDDLNNKLEQIKTQQLKQSENQDESKSIENLQN